MPDLPTGRVTLLFTDIEGSTRLLEELGDRYADVLAEHRRLLRDSFARHGGVEVDTQGDAFFYVFAGATDAVAAAARAQKALSGGPVAVRMGIHTGEPIVTEEGYVGIDVHRAARIMSAGHGGQVVVSERTRAELDASNKLLLADLGLHRLKDLGEPEELHQVGDGHFPPLRTLDPTNLPVAASPLLGREQELEELLLLLRNGTRLLTVTGPGGTGKTRLALQVAAELVGSYKDGVFWVPLAGLGDPELVLAEVAQTLGAREDLHDYLRGKELLLLLDNAEHLLGAAPALGTLLASTEGLRLLVTSRAPLHLSGEREYPLEPLPPGDAVTLFCERARAVGRDLAPDQTIVAIARRLDGLPLAIELAAARTRLLAPETLLERLEHALPLLTGGARDAPERQQTLRGTIQWSHDLLDEAAKRVFARLSVFAGSFSLGAAEGVCEADLDSLAALVDLSLLKPIGEDRFLMLETIREFGLDCLQAAGDEDRRRDAHARYYLELAEELEPHLRIGARRVPSVDRLAADVDNLRAALMSLHESGASEQALRLAIALWRFWMAKGYFREGQAWIERGLGGGSATTPLRAAALEGLGALVALQGAERAGELTEESLALYRELGDARGIAETLNNLAIHTQREDARALLDESAELARRGRDTHALALALSNLAELSSDEGDYERAVALSQESAALWQAQGDAGYAATPLLTVGAALLGQGRHNEARDALCRCLESFESSPQGEWPLWALARLADTEAAVGELDCAARLLGAADALLESIGSSWGDDVEVRQRAALRQRVAKEALGAYEAGRALTLEEAVAYATGGGRAEATAGGRS